MCVWVCGVGALIQDRLLVNFYLHYSSDNKALRSPSGPGRPVLPFFEHFLSLNASMDVILTAVPVKTVF